MRLGFFVLFISSIIFSCGEEKSNNDTDEHTSKGNLKSAERLDTCTCDELTIDDADTYKKEGELFTGICYSNYPETDVRYVEKNYLGGKLHGNVIYYSKNGDVLIEEVYESGQQKRSASSDALEVSCTELDKKNIGNNVSRYYLDEIPFTGRCSDYYADSSHIYMEAHYENGLRNGHVIYYARDGSTLFLEKYENGILINTINAQ